jgi:immunity protein 21 of polymorphic toxin system
MSRPGPDRVSPRLHWITSCGGPLLLLPAEYLDAWEGAEEPSDGRVVEAEFRWNLDPDAPATDYDRACDVEDYVGIIPVGAGQGLVFPDKLTTTWWPQSPSSGMLIRGYTDHADLLPTLAALPEEAWQAELFTFEVGQGPLYLIDSAHPGSAAILAPHLVLHLLPGNYRIRTYVLHSDTLGWKPLHSLTRVGNE